MTDSTRCYQQMFYTLQEAALYLATPEHEVRRLIREHTLPVCFNADTNITGVSIQRPDSTIEHIDITLHIDGTFKSFYSGQERESFEAAVIEVFRVEYQQFSCGPGLVPLKGHKLPTTEHQTGYIQPGYVVSGFVDFIQVESADWRFHVDDLAALIADQKANAVTTPADDNKGPDNQGTGSAVNAGKAATPAAIAKRYAELKRTREHAYTKQTAKEFGCSERWVTRCVKDEKSKPPSGMVDMTKQLSSQAKNPTQK